MKHSPGPWVAVRTVDGTEIQDARTALIGFVEGGAATEDADARLIAAAPELLEALREVVEAPHHCQSCGYVDKAEPDDWPDQRALIARIEGTP